MTILYDNIAELVTNDPTTGDHSPLGIITDAALLVDGTQIAWIGPHSAAPDAEQRVDCQRRAVIPGFVDSHAHLVFDGDRAAEFAARMAGQPYDGGGIATTVAATRNATDATLAATVARLSRELRHSGVTTFETKSGYGLTVDDEARSLRVASAFTSETTFLGAHVVPAEFATRRDAYVDLVRTTMLDACAPHARWIDVFCDRGAFDVDEARAILTAGIAHGLHPDCTPANSVAATASCSPSPSTPPRWITAPTPPTRTSKLSPDPPRSPPCYPAQNSAPAPNGPTDGASSTPVSQSRSPPTATPEAPTRPACRCASPWPCAICTSPQPKPSGRPPPVAQPLCVATTSDRSQLGGALTSWP